MARWRITTLTTITPWVKEFDSKEELCEWLTSMDIADSWYKNTRTIWEKDIGSEYSVHPTVTHKKEKIP